MGKIGNESNNMFRLEVVHKLDHMLKSFSSN